MKPSKSTTLKELAKNYLEEERSWTGDELILDKPYNPMKKTTPPRRVPAAPAPASRVSDKSANASVADKPRAASGKAAALQKYKDEIKNCKKCPLGKSRLNFVFGVGDPDAQLMFVGEGPGFDEDHKGEPFVGRSGQLLTKIIEAAGYRREDVFIANIVKCHPMIDPSDPEKHGNDRPPAPEEVATCIPYLHKQIEIIHPKVICTLGSPSSKTLSGLDTPISKLRGNWLEYALPSGETIKMMPTFHPAALLRNPNLKKDVWEDIKQIMTALGKKPKKS
ncbi:MAG: uracil-DNA glycosylase [Elusimicrobiota bacterium]